MPTKLEKGRFVYQTLVSTAEHTQVGLIAQLDSLGVEYRSYWIANMVWVRGSLGTVQELAARPDVAHLYANPMVALDVPTVENAADAQPNAIEWNISLVGAPQVWDLGLYRSGGGHRWSRHRLSVGSSRPDRTNTAVGMARLLIMTTTGTMPSMTASQSLRNNSPEPCDDYGHGTHTMGTMVGDDGG